MRFLNFVLTRAQNVLPSEKLAAARKLVLKNCDFIVDIGANDGQWINEVRKKRGGGAHMNIHGVYFAPPPPPPPPKGEALCIEPLKKNYMKLKSRNFTSTSFLNCAIGNLNGYTYINEASNGGLSSSILELDSYHKNAAPNIKFIKREKVKILKLSKVIENIIHKKMFIKIDKLISR